MTPQKWLVIPILLSNFYQLINRLFFFPVQRGARELKSHSWPAPVSGSPAMYRRT